IQWGISRRLETEVHTWQRTTNIVAPSTLNDLWNRHIIDSLQLTNYLSAESNIIDLGSGGGFPALPLAVWQSVEGSACVTAVESNRKKTSFLRQTSQKLGIAKSLKVRSERIEKLEAFDVQVDVVTARALASLDQLLAFVGPWASRNPSLRCLFHKGREYRSEVDCCRGEWSFDLIEHCSMTSPDARILEISNLQRKTDLTG
ncbi:MAG: 16S rRNA (guanine(527)-N(7))-methyltransferase RsmG, partial [Pseudomonadota bacterium]